MLELRKISRGYQITLPRSFRDKHHLEIGDVVELLEEDGNILIKPLRKEDRQNAAKRLIRFLEDQGDTLASMTEEEIFSLVKEEKNKIGQTEHENRS